MFDPQHISQLPDSSDLSSSLFIQYIPNLKDTFLLGKNHQIHRFYHGLSELIIIFPRKNSHVQNTLEPSRYPHFQRHPNFKPTLRWGTAQPHPTLDQLGAQIPRSLLLKSHKMFAEKKLRRILLKIPSATISYGFLLQLVLNPVLLHVYCIIRHSC